MTSVNKEFPDPKLAWLDKIQSDIISSPEILKVSKGLAQQATELNASMRLGVTPSLNFQSSAAMASLKRAQESIDRSNSVLMARSEQMVKIAESILSIRPPGLDPVVMEQLTGIKREGTSAFVVDSAQLGMDSTLKTSLDVIKNFNPPLAGISAITEAGRIVPPKSVVEGFDISALNQVATAASSNVGSALAFRGVHEAIKQATKHLTVSEQLLNQMRGMSSGVQVAIDIPSVVFPDFEKFATASRIIGEHYNKANIDNILQRFQQLEEELNLDIPVESADDIDDLVEDTEAVEFIEKQITENGIRKPSISQVLFGFNFNELTITQSGSLVLFCGSIINFLYEVLGALIEGDVTAARYFAVVVIYLFPVIGTGMVTIGELDKGSPAA